MQMNDLITQIRNFRQTISGDPQAQLQAFIKQNNIPQQALDYAQQQANEVYKAMPALSGR